MWTVAADSPLRKGLETWNPDAFMVDEDKRQNHKANMTAYVQQELGKQMEEVMAYRQTMKDEGNEMARAVSADIARQKRRSKLEADEAAQSRANLRATLDKQKADLDRRARESRLQQLTEGAELKARTMQQLTQELQSQANRKKGLKKDADDMRREIERRAQQTNDDKLRAQEELRNTIKEQTLQDEFRLAATQDRLRAAQANSDAKEANYNRTAGAELNAKNTHELTRQDRDEKKMQMRQDLHYSRREAARERQRQNMLNTLNMQQGADRNRKELERIGKEKDKEAVDTAARLALESDMARHRQRRQEEVETQAQLVKMMAEKQARERVERDGFKPPASTNTMEVNKAFLDMSIARATCNGNFKSSDPMHHVDAAKHLDKPMGKVEVKPWVDIAKSHGLGGVNGVFGGEGHMKLKLASTGGLKRILTKTTGLAMRDHAMQATWSEGLSDADMKTGLKAAKKRHHANMVDKTDRF